MDLQNLMKTASATLAQIVIVYEWEQPIFSNIGQWGKQPDLFTGCHVKQHSE